jgi:hypothetical protein
MDKTSLMQSSATAAPDKSFGGPTGYLRQEYDAQRKLFEAQPALVQRFLEAQARQIADAIVQRLAQVRFALPDRIVVEANKPAVVIPIESREELAGGLIDRLTRSDLGDVVRQRLAELEQSSNKAVASGAGLLRYATATYMVHAMLPAGRSVTYVAAEGEEIPTIPLSAGPDLPEAITASTDAIAEEEQPDSEAVLVPYVPAARRFYLPQWVSFDDEDRLLVNSINEAEAHIASMERFLAILHASVSLAPYMVADEGYQQKRHGMLGQLINQGRALARYETGEIIRTIKHRAAAHALNRGLSLSLPYFDDQTLKVELHDFEVIPAGRIMFVPAFVVRAAREEQVKVAQDTRLSPSTRKYLLAELKLLEQAFEANEKRK